MTSSKRYFFMKWPSYIWIGWIFASGLFPSTAVAQQPRWWDQGTCYEVFVRSFQDSDGDGYGDFRGLTAKLRYINELGVKCIWLMPIAQSPSYHGYDVSNYYQVNRDYGTNADFRAFVAAAHRLGIAVIPDMVLNHVSSQHPFFRSALLDRGSPYRDWFIWSATRPPQPRDWRSPVWHKVDGRDEYYFGLFWSGMPDLNLGNPAVMQEAKNIARFWLQDMHVDGFRFDAVQQFFEDADSTRNAPPTHAWLRDYSAYIHSIAPNSFTVGEMWDSTRYVALYYPDQLDTYFNLQIADALLDAATSGSSRRLVGAVNDAQRYLPPGRYATFLRNHDQTRTMTVLGGDVRRAKLAATLLLTLPGIPFIYYGEELGMTGDKPDERLRTPMAWTRAPGVGFTTGQVWEPLQPDSFTANVSVLAPDSSSLLNLYRRLVRLRNLTPALGAATNFTAIETGSEGLLAYLRDSTVLVVANLTTEPASADVARLVPGRRVVRTLYGRRQLGPLETVVLEVR